MIDPHVHFRDWNQKDKETILHGMRVGLEAGFNIFLDMPNTNPPLTTKENALKRIEDGKKAIEELKKEYHNENLHYSIYLGLTDNPAQVEEMVSLHDSLFPDVCGLKLFASQSTGNMGITTIEAQERIYRTLSELNYRGVLAVHSEKESLFNHNETEHSRIRTSLSEVGSISDQIENAMKNGFKGRLHIAHISTRDGIKLVEEAKREGMKITCGATPHHSLLTRENESVFRKMNPPLRDRKDRESVLEALFDGEIDWVESDHAPHTLSDKLAGASGIPGFEGMLRLITFLRREGMTEERLNDLFSNNAIKIFNLPFSSTPVPKVTEEMIERVGGEYQFSAWR